MKNLRDAAKALLVQDHQLKMARTRSTHISERISSIRRTLSHNNSELDELETSLSMLLNENGLNENSCGETKFDHTDLPIINEIELGQIANDNPVFEPLETVSTVGDWNGYMECVDSYLHKYELDTDVDPILQILPFHEVARLEKEYNIKFGNITWNKWDYSVVFLSACVATLVDYFIVKIPGDIIFKGNSYSGSPLTKFMREQERNIMNSDLNKSGLYSWLQKTQKNLEEYGKVAYDFPSNRPEILGVDIKGLSPKTHRLQSFGHDPLLGFIIGTFDIMRGKMTVIGSDGVISVIDRAKFGQHGIIEAFMMQTAHLLSDITTPQGIPAPFLSVLQCITAKSPFSLSNTGVKVTFNDVSRFMYSNGYTIEHFLSMSIVPMVVEIIVRLYYNVANYEAISSSINSYSSTRDVKLKSMLCMAHTMTMAGNIGKMWLFGWNPLAFNLTEMLRCTQSFYSLYKAKQEREKYIDENLLNEWKKLSGTVCQ